MRISPAATSAASTRPRPGRVDVSDPGGTNAAGTDDRRSIAGDRASFPAAGRCGRHERPGGHRRRACCASSRVRTIATDQHERRPRRAATATAHQDDGASGQRRTDAWRGRYGHRRPARDRDRVTSRGGRFSSTGRRPPSLARPSGSVRSRNSSSASRPTIRRHGFAIAIAQRLRRPRRSGTSARCARAPVRPPSPRPRSRAPLSAVAHGQSRARRAARG